MPALRRREEDRSTDYDHERTTILVEKFFLKIPDLDIENGLIETWRELPSLYRKEIQVVLSLEVTQN